ncbi:hypothetical protein [Bradyrhizobium sp. JYMT SZCCT0180]|uniref:hypothetical protein n=1 Tax=Bradyrhizobium sp. JYMT SZCCT0180 TaxID=2807666 RepID=UPI001BA510E5|nr:hypothetical protein [Bradyrhizobium sp. JYMT SZCCT0180]MBR1215684.1 hypothetical protein [Bradyrhizobium sp. JYMT SZCCT0180]
MRNSAIALMAGLAIVVAASSATGQSAQPYSPGLVEFMMSVQTHHVKLWLAGNARNWELADYQLDELKELLEEIAKRVPKYRDVPVGQMIEAATMPPIGKIEAAIKARDSAKFVAAFDRLTEACNSCHEAANRGFIVIQRPATSSFPNQSFAPRRK